MSKIVDTASASAKDGIEGELSLEVLMGIVAASGAPAPAPAKRDELAEQSIPLADKAPSDTAAPPAPPAPPAAKEAGKFKNEASDRMFTKDFAKGERTLWSSDGDKKAAPKDDDTRPRALSEGAKPAPGSASIKEGPKPVASKPAADDDHPRPHSKSVGEKPTEPKAPAKTKSDIGYSSDQTVHTTGAKDLVERHERGDGSITQSVTAEAKVVKEFGFGMADGNAYLKGGFNASAEIKGEGSERWGQHEISSAVSAGAKAGANAGMHIGADGVVLKFKIAGDATIKTTNQYTYQHTDGSRTAVIVGAEGAVKGELGGEFTFKPGTVTAAGKIGGGAVVQVATSVKAIDSDSKTTLEAGGGVQVGLAAGVDGSLRINDGVYTLTLGVTGAIGVGLKGNIALDYDTRPQIDAMKAVAEQVKDPNSTMSKELKVLKAELVGKDARTVGGELLKFGLTKGGGQMMEASVKKGGVIGLINNGIGAGTILAGPITPLAMKIDQGLQSVGKTVQAESKMLAKDLEQSSPWVKHNVKQSMALANGVAGAIHSSITFFKKIF